MLEYVRIAGYESGAVKDLILLLCLRQCGEALRISLVMIGIVLDLAVLNLRLVCPMTQDNFSLSQHLSDKDFLLSLYEGRSVILLKDIKLQNELVELVSKFVSTATTNILKDIQQKIGS